MPEAKGKAPSPSWCSECGKALVCDDETTSGLCMWHLWGDPQAQQKAP